MPYINSDLYESNDYIALACGEAVYLHIAAMCHCEQQQSNGFVDDVFMPKLFEWTLAKKWRIKKNAVIKKLIDIGWWKRVSGGYLVPPNKYFQYIRTSPNKLKQMRYRFRAVRKYAITYLTEKFGYQCVYCGETYRLEVDHIKPLSKGGSNDLENLQLLCGHCNRKKHASYEE